MTLAIGNGGLGGSRLERAVPSGIWVTAMVRSTWTTSSPCHLEAGGEPTTSSFSVRDTTSQRAERIESSDDEERAVENFTIIAARYVGRLRTDFPWISRFSGFLPTIGA
jgi:hypothetical protein